MEQRIFSELRTVYSTNHENPHMIRIRIRMRDLIDPKALRHAVDTTMTRYPYFCVELQKKDGAPVYVENCRPVVITNTFHGVRMNSEESNYHMVSFSWMDNWITLDIYHGLTDGTGAYELLRTFLYYYCSDRYGVELNEEDIRLAGETIQGEEWEDPLLTAQLPAPMQTNLTPALNFVEMAGLQNDREATVYNLSVSEAEFMRFNIENDGSPGTMVCLFLSRAIAKLFPDAELPVRISLCVNQRKALHTPLAHQSLVGGAMLEYKKKLQDWSLDRQATAYRGMVFAQSMEEAVLASLVSQKGIAQMILSKESDQERAGIAGYIDHMAKQVLSATVSYVGKANYKGAEAYIRDFRTWTMPSGGVPLVEISAVNGTFNLDFLQIFSSPLLVNAFTRELEENGITYELKDVMKLELPEVALPWDC